MMINYAKVLYTKVKNFIDKRKYEKQLEELFKTFPFLKSEEEYNRLRLKDYIDLTELEKELIMYYVGIQCSSFIINEYPVRVCSKDIEKHLRKEIDIFELERHINSPTKDSPKEIYLNDRIWVLDIDKLEYNLKRDDI